MERERILASSSLLDFMSLLLTLSLYLIFENPPNGDHMRRTGRGNRMGVYVLYTQLFNRESPYGKRLNQKKIISFNDSIKNNLKT